MPFVGGHGAGIVALGGAIGVPVLLLVFLGSAGITSIIESFAKNTVARPLLVFIAALIVRDHIKLRISASLRAAMIDEIEEAKHFDMPIAEKDIREKLLVMDPFDFERHVVSFFSASGMNAWVTRKTNDMGVDGFAEHTEGVIVIQCKRYASENPIDRPEIQKFKGAMEDVDSGGSGAWKGYFVTTSRFTAGARESADKSGKLVLVDMDELVQWHAISPNFQLID